MLAEAIKTSAVPVERLLPIFYDGSVQPDWPQMLLPHGEFDRSDPLRAPEQGSPGHQEKQPTDAAPFLVLDN